MTQKMNGLCREMIIHPGETLRDVITERNIAQNELALRTGVTPKHISSVLNGESSISPAFAKKLEYALGIEAVFWINLQNLYDKELVEFEELHSILKEEFEIAKNIKDVATYCISKGWIVLSGQIENKILEFRKFFNVSNLNAMRAPVFVGAFKTRVNLKPIPEVVFAWQKVCELSTAHIECSEMSIEKSKQFLTSRLPEIKACQTLDSDDFIKKLTDIFSSCGIAFSVVPNFKGAPVQGFISQTSPERTVLCMTFREKRADVFWFTLFHEIGHFLNGDSKKRLVDFEKKESSSEKSADLFAENVLIPKKDYNSFIRKNDFSYKTIVDFASEQNILPDVVIGRLQNDKKLSWSTFSDKMKKYNFF